LAKPDSKKEISMRFVKASLLVLAACVLVVPCIVQAQTASDMEILRQKLKADKKLVVAQAMQLSDAEAAGFWPVYEAYQADLGKLNTRLGQLIKSYAEAFRADTLTNDKAQALTDEALKIEQAEVDMRRACLPKLSAVVSPVKAARYLQVENKIRAVLKFDLATEIPLAK
jgi:hypothetical protein